MKPLRTFTVCAAFRMCEESATFAVLATDFADACREAVEQIDSGHVSTSRASYDPGQTFVNCVVEGDGDPWAGCGNVPLEYGEDHATAPRSQLELAAPDMLAALKRAAFIMSSPSIAHLTNGAGALDDVRAAIAKAEGRD